MKGICSIDTCRMPNELRKIHERFEGVIGINICWECGNLIIEGLIDNG